MDFRVLTDFVEAKNYYTLRRLYSRGPVRDLPGLHAKIYIFDDSALVASANLTRAGFNKLFEIGLLLEGDEADDVIRYYENRWNEEAQDLSREQIFRLDAEPSTKSDVDQGSDRSLKDRWGLPPPATDADFSLDDLHELRHYQQFIINFNDLANLYNQNGRLWPDLPLSIEVDAFLNYLFHDHPLRPSHKHFSSSASMPRQLDTESRRREVGFYARAFAEFDKQDAKNRDMRHQRFDKLTVLLEKDRIANLSWRDVEEVVRCLHSLKAYPPNVNKFIDPDNNDLQVVQRAWSKLLYGTDRVEARIEACDNSLAHFGRSSIQELLGWHRPKKFPIRNSNTNAGMLFFGYRV